MARIDEIGPEEIDEYTQKLFDAQTRQYGAPLFPYLYYARRPPILRAVRGMWMGIAASGLIDKALQALVNRRVAGLNGCQF